jgi:hypothetical protein
MYYIASFIGGVIVTIIAEFIAVYFYGRRAANRKGQES